MSGSQETVEAISDDVSKTRSLSSSSTSSDDSDYDADRGYKVLASVPLLATMTASRAIHNK